MTRTSDEWYKVYQELDAIWMHDGDPRRPHALLRSQKHSSGFFNSRLVICHEPLMRDAASDLLELVTENKAFDISEVQVVVGPQTGATKLAEYLSDQITAFNRDECSHASPAKATDGEVEIMVFTDEEKELICGRRVLLCEDVVTTLGSVERAERAVLDAGGTILPYVLVLVNRSGVKEIHGKKIVALIDRDMPTWTADECPLCNDWHSEAIPPKGENWALLNATFEPVAQ